MGKGYLGCHGSINYETKFWSQMLNQRFVQNKELGKHQQGKKFPIQSTPRMG